MTTLCTEQTTSFTSVLRSLLGHPLMLPERP
jgi:hypothetical protein